MDAIPLVLQPFFRQHFAAVLQEDRPWEHLYECSSPEQLRLFHMLVFSLRWPGAVDFAFPVMRDSS